MPSRMSERRVPQNTCEIADIGINVSDEEEQEENTLVP